MTASADMVGLGGHRTRSSANLVAQRPPGSARTGTVRDYERLTASHEAMITRVMIALMALPPRPPHPFIKHSLASLWSSSASAGLSHSTSGMMLCSLSSSSHLKNASQARSTRMP
jgi:hypothetical protein